MVLEKRHLTYFLRQYRPQLVDFTAYLTHIKIVKGYAREVKDYDPDITTVVGGLHAEVCPHDFDDHCIDYVTGRNGMRALCKITKGGYYGPDTVSETTFDYPLPDRTKTASYRKHYRYLFHDSCALIKTSFGCPFSCKFCFGSQITQGNYFCRDLESVIAELKTIEEENVFIADDTFLYDKGPVDVFCDRLTAEGIRKQFVVFGRTDFVVQYPETVHKFKAAGLRGVFLGIESFSDTDLQNFDKRTTAAMNRQALEILDDLGILHYCGMIAHYHWTRADFDRLLKDARRFKHIMINLQPLTPMPGTANYEEARDKLLIPLEDSAYWGGGHLLIRPEKMSPNAFYYNILRVYLKTGFRLSMHGMVLRRYGIIAYLRAAAGSMAIFRQYIKLILGKHREFV